MDAHLADAVAGTPALLQRLGDVERDVEETTDLETVAQHVGGLGPGAQVLCVTGADEGFVASVAHLVPETTFNEVGRNVAIRANTETWGKGRKLLAKSLFYSTGERRRNRIATLRFQ